MPKKSLKPVFKAAALQAVDLFSGCGGLTTGLKSAGFKVVGAVEIDPLAVATYNGNHPEVEVRQADIGKVTARGFMRDLGLAPGELDLLSGCPPCQGFSRLRTKNGSSRNRDSRNGLSSEMLRFTRAFLPKAVMMENVPGLARHQSFRDLCSGLRSLGYHVHFGIKDAGRYGVPQRRRRLILLAGRGFAIKLAPEAETVVTVRDAIGSMPSPGASGDTLHDVPERRSPRIQQLINDIPKDGGSRTDLPHERQLPCHKNNDGFHDIYGRMAWDAVAPTITGGCFNPSKGRFLHPDQNRAITLREAALLQGFPRQYSFDLTSGKEAVALMIGNALPPEFIRRHAAEIRKAIVGRTRRART
jgi:DNA (cytosine-5)-methyltransferase 1